MTTNDTPCMNCGAEPPCGCTEPMPQAETKHTVTNSPRETQTLPERKSSIFMTEDQARVKLMTGEAMQSAKRLIDSFFQNDNERPRASIPARPDYDDDLIVTDCLRFAAKLSASPPAKQVTDAARDLLAERQRQISAEGWTPEHDDDYGRGEMASAAACYAEPVYFMGSRIPQNWPWASQWWKPTDRRRDLVKAGALILAEIERLDRQAKTLRHDNPAASLVRERFDPESEADDAS